MDEIFSLFLLQNMGFVCEWEVFEIIEKLSYGETPGCLQLGGNSASAACARLAWPCQASRNTPALEQARPRGTRDGFVYAHGNFEGDQARLVEIGRLQRRR